MSAIVKKSESSNRHQYAIDEIVKPQNAIIERLQNKVNHASMQDPRTKYSRMHNRHNRS